ncbi:uncharacterized protein GBIM_22219, partial [Gryllus bimaculatus]
SNRNGTNLATLAATRRGVCVCAPKSPTYFPTAQRRTRKRSGIIDFAIAKGVDGDVPSSLPELDSDHNPVICVVASLVAVRHQRMRTTRDTDWVGYQAQRPLEQIAHLTLACHS